MNQRVLLLVGCGKMGKALLTRWRDSYPADIKKIWVIEPNTRPLTGMRGSWVADLKFLPRNVRPQIVVFAIKPQQMPAILPAYRRRFGDRPLYISIAAGKTVGFFISHFDSGARVVRVMPNLAATVGESMSVLYAPPKLSRLSRRLATELMEQIGEIAWVKDEAQMDAVTALSGSGPAYVFLFIECLVEAAVSLGLPKDLAHKLALQTVVGSCALIAQSKDTLEMLRHKVTSPGGTTEAALEIFLENNQFPELLTRAIRRAAERSRELSL